MEHIIKSAIETALSTALQVSGPLVGSGIAYNLLKDGPQRPEKDEPPRTYRQRQVDSPGVGSFNPGGSGGGIIASKFSKKRSKKSKKNALSKKAKQEIIQLVKKNPSWDLVLRLHKNSMHQLVSAVNKVDWSILSNDEYLDYVGNFHPVAVVTTADNVTTKYVADYGDIDQAVGAYKQFKIDFQSDMIFKNNSNAPCEMCLYLFISKDDTNNNPNADLNDRLSAQKRLEATSATSGLAKEDSFFQYWVTPDMKSCQWKVKDYKKVMLNGGDEFRATFKHTFMLPLDAQNSTTYIRDLPVIIARVMGRPSHDTTTVGNLGISDTRVDMLQHRRLSYYVKEDLQNTSKYADFANTSFSAITPVVAGDVNVADVTDG